MNETARPVSPEDLLDRTETCRSLHISRQTLITWIRKGKIKVWKRVGAGSNAALLFHREEVESLQASDHRRPRDGNGKETSGLPSPVVFEMGDQLSQ